MPQCMGVARGGSGGSVEPPNFQNEKYTYFKRERALCAYARS